MTRAHALQPSYVAIGPIFPTITKEMPFLPQGIKGLHRWRRTLEYPLVAIGGIFLSNAEKVLMAGANGMAVVRDIAEANDIENRIQQWLQLFDYQKNIPIVQAVADN